MKQGIACYSQAEKLFSLKSLNLLPHKLFDPFVIKTYPQKTLALPELMHFALCQKYIQCPQFQTLPGVV